MVRVHCELAVGAPAGAVWAVVSDIDSEPDHWRGTRSVRNVSRRGNVTEREITLAFRDRVCGQRVTLEPPAVVRAEFTSGMITGTKVVRVRPDGESRAVVEATWEIGVRGMMSVLAPMLSSHIRSGTEQALESIRRAAESR